MESVFRSAPWIGILLWCAGFKAEAGILRSYHESIRSLGMGGVRISHPYEAQAFVWNPAYLGFNKGFNLSIVDAGAGINGLQAYETFTDVNWGGGLSGLSPLYGKPVWVGAWGWAALSWGFWGAYYLTSYDVSVTLKDPGLPSLDVSYYKDDFYILGFGFPITPQLSAGLNIKRVIRTGGDKTFSTADLTDPNFMNDLLGNIQAALNNQGYGWGGDIGLAYRWNKPFAPTLSLAWQDVGYTSFATKSPMQKVPALRDNLILSATVREKVWGFGFAGGLEYRHIGNNDEPLGKKIHLGSEISIPFVDLRAGLYQGYVSYGAGLDLWILRLDAAWYKLETGIYPGQTPQERIVLTLNLDMSFDPDFEIRDSQGNKRKLFKRR